jgi:plastocyanin
VRSEAIIRHCLYHVDGEEVIVRNQAFRVVTALIGTLILLALLQLNLATQAADPTSHLPGYLPMTVKSLPRDQIAVRRTAARAASWQQDEPWSTVYVVITEEGFEPREITVTVGSRVIWTNDTSESVRLEGAFGSRIYLPLVLRRSGASQVANRDHDDHPSSDTSRVSSSVLLAPGESYSNDFSVPGRFTLRIQEPSPRESQVNVEPHQIDDPGLAWATGPEGVLLRWYWPQTDETSGRPMPQPTGYLIYRDSQLLTPTPVACVTDAATAQAILGAHWDWIQATYTEVPTIGAITTIDEFHQFLDQNPLAERWLADQRYPVALVRALGYLDGSVLPGDPMTHTYRVQAVFPGYEEDVGTLTLQNLGVTPLDPPDGLRTTRVISEGLRSSPDWVAAQRNRQGHARVHLAWDLPGEAARMPEKWVTSYDIYRAGPVAPGQDPTQMNFTLLTADDPVVPMEDHDPTSPFTNTRDSYASLPYPRYESYYVDKGLPACERYAYRVAARDLLGQPAGQSAHVEAIVPDTMPPEPPHMLTPTLDHHAGNVLISWEPVTDADGYEIYRSEVLTAAWPGLADCSDPGACWTRLDDLGATSFTDAPSYGQRYWYVVRALDTPCSLADLPNRSAPSNAVTAMLQDRVPPSPPSVDAQERTVVIDPSPDTTEILMYCAFDDGSATVPEPMLIDSVPVTPAGSTVHFDMVDYYSPAVPVTPTCSTQALDAHGNYSTKTAFQTPQLCPTHESTLTPPVIVSITTVLVSDAWAANVVWEIEPDQPGLAGFRVRRHEGVTKTLVAELGPEARSVRDTDIIKGPVYSYTVSAVVVPACDEFGSEVTSAPRLYRVVPPLGRCTREPNELTWDLNRSEYVGGSGAYLAWYYPFGLDQAYARTVIYRSLTRDGNYVAITPPFDTMAYDYWDTDAEHGDYWYVVAMLDWATGEILAQTAPWSPVHGLGPGPTAAATPPRDGNSGDVDRSPSPVLPEDELISTALTSRSGETVTLEAAIDTYVTSIAASQNYGAASPLEVWYSSDGGDAHALVRFDFADLPDGSLIEGASFNAYSEEDFMTTSQIELYRNTQAWGEMDVTWLNRPLISGPYVTATVGTAPTWVVWEVTPLVQAWIDGTYANHGLAMVSATDSAFRAFTSREGGSAPYLSVQYVPPPETLTFGSADDNLFVVTGVSYDAGSTPGCLTGSGTVTLGDGGLGATYDRQVGFTCIAADYETGVVTAGTAEVALPDPIPVNYSGRFEYAVHSLTLGWDTAEGEVRLTLPPGLLFQYTGVTYDPLPLTPAVIHQDLGFAATRAWGGSCEDPLPAYTIEMEPLPLRVVPQGEVLLFHDHVNLGSICTLYEERYSGTRPAFPAPDANDGYLRPVYTGLGGIIHPSGLSTALRTDEPMSYTTVQPYGFEISATGPITIEIWQSQLHYGVMHGVDVRLKYYRGTSPYTLVIDDSAVEPPEGIFIGSASALYLYEGGSLAGTVTTDPAMDPVEWGNKNGGRGFVLEETDYFLYLPPVQSAADHLPWEEANANALGTQELQAGLNLVEQPPDANFTWYHCEQDEPITFPEGVTVDVYLRRGGISDEISAHISLGNPVAVPLYGYDTEITGFRLSFCDNYIYDSDVSANVDLPYPTNQVVTLVDILINPNTACVESGQVPETTLTPAYWEIDLHPRAGEFRRKAAAPPPQLPKWTRDLWLIGTMDVPHLAPYGSDNVAPIPMETAFHPEGDIMDNRPVHNKANYTFDGFPLLLSGVQISPYLSDPPNWHGPSNLDQAPNVTGRGFVTVTGNMVEPIFGTLKGDVTEEPPALFVLGWDPYVGFSDQPAPQRTWTFLTDITWGFKLVYAQHWDVSNPRGTFVSFRSDDLVVVRADQALVLSSIGAQGPRAHLMLGLSAGSGVLRALAETRVNPLPSTWQPALEQTMRNAWLPRLPDLDAKYVDFLEDMWDMYATSSYTQTTAVIDAWADTLANEGKTLPEDPPGGGTTPVLSYLLKPTEWDVQLRKMRGAVLWEHDGNDYHFEECRFSLWFMVKREEDREPLVEGERLTFRITRDAEYVIEGYNTVTRIYDYPEIKGDFQLAIRTKIPSVEGAITVRDFSAEGLAIDEAAVTLGVGTKMFYLGGLVDNAHPSYAESLRLGGAFLMGALDPGSLVLKGTGFESILNDIGATGATQANGGLDDDGRLVGGYVRVYGEMPLYGDSCFFRLSAGGEVAVWYFAATGYQDGGCDRYGGRLRGYLHGDLLCVVSARGDLTLEVYRSPTATSCGAASFRGKLWAAGGIGFCDPEGWSSWESRWWGDSWCWTAGAEVDAKYDGNTKDWDWHYDADYE